MTTFASDASEKFGPNRERLPARERWVLAIDGGGIRGIIPATICEHIERKTGRKIYELFDMCAGTSTGGILCLGFSRPPHGIPAKEMLRLYTEKAGNIFGFRRRLIWYAAFPRYSYRSFEQLLWEQFCEARLSDCLTETVITSYDIRLRQPHIFRRRDARRDPTQDTLMKEIARATSAAPTYFAPAAVMGTSLIDGGVFANDPSLAAYIEAKLLWPDDRIRVVSLGTGSLVSPILRRRAARWGAARWATAIVDCAFDGTSKMTEKIMQALLADDYLRFQCCLGKGSERLDGVSEINLAELQRVANDLLKDRQNDIYKLCNDLRLKKS